jgi:hypothetical protein
VKCKDEKCKRIVEDIETQIKTLTMTSQVPKAPGLYLMYYNKLFGTNYWESYITEQLNTKWPSQPFYYKPNGITLSLNKVLTNMALELSNGAWENVSILDVPGFGSMVNNFDTVIKQGMGIFSFSKTEVCGIPWNNQLNMAIFHEMARSYSWSKTWEKTINTECLNMKKLWKKYMTTFNATDFPPARGNNTLFNYTNSIKDGMTMFLAIYAASFQTSLNENQEQQDNKFNSNQTTKMDITQMLRETGKKVFKETESDDYVKKNTIYDKLIMDCAFKTPLMTKKTNAISGCGEFSQSLTNNGICHSFNGMNPLKLWRDAEIVQAFNKVFESHQTKPHMFRGSGASEGKEVQVGWSMMCDFFYAENNIIDGPACNHISTY